MTVKIIPIQNLSNTLMRYFFTLHKRWWMRGLSFLIAVLMSAIIFIFPQSIAADMQQLNHGLLSVMLLAVCACFVHGVGFTTGSSVVNYLISPFFTLPVLLFVALRLWG